MPLQVGDFDVLVSVALFEIPELLEVRQVYVLVGKLGVHVCGIATQDKF